MRMQALRRGFTLIELMLALTLTAIIMGVLATAMDFNMRTLESRRAYVEEAQLARAILRLIATDLRNTVQDGLTATVESAAEEAGGADAAAGAAGAAGDAGAAGAGAGAAGAAGDLAGADLGDDAAEINEMITENNADIASATSVPEVPGLYGNSTQLQIDVSRPPRVEEFANVTPDMDDPTAIRDLPSDVKTVAYYIQSDRSSGTGDPNERDLQYGLVRRALDRLVTLQATEVGNSDALLNAGEVVAPEVASISFRYFDGTQWLTEWDSSVSESLPLAVEIMLVLRERSDSSPSLLSTFSTPPELEVNNFYRLVVRLPVAKPPAEEEDESGLESLGL